MAHVKELSAESLLELKNIEGLRINTDLRERHLYESDMGELPSMPKRLVGKTTPAAIVQPQNENEVIQVVAWANKYSVPIIPRAAASSGYGGVVPVPGSVVMELVHFNKIIHMDTDKKTVTVEPGIVWKDLEFKLNAAGLAVRMMPTSAPASTVGGWLAQGGGAGFGSYQYGLFEQNVESATVITPDGSKITLAAKDLSLVSGAMGTTGIITSITLRLRALEKHTAFGIEAKTPAQVQEILEQIDLKGLPLWHAGFMNPTAARLKNRVPPKTHHGHPLPKPVLPESYILLLACDESRAASVEKKLAPIVKDAGAVMLPQDITEHEWEDRFNPMKIKRIGPSLVPAEVIVPLNRIAEVFEQMEETVKPPVLVEATMVSSKHIVLLCLIPHDARKLTFNLAFTLSLSILKLAKRYGGRAYASGLYLAQEANQVHRTRISQWLNFKREKDAKNLFNPRKLSGIPLMKMMIGTALAFEPMVRIMGNRIKPQLRENWKAKNGLPGDVVWYAYSCARCGYCRNVCELYGGKGWESTSPRGKWAYLRRVAEGREKFDQEMTNNFLKCTTCERCDFTCQLDLPIEPSWAVMRGELVNSGKQMTFPAFELMAASAGKEKNIWANFAEKRDEWVPEDLRPKIKDKAEIAYFPGCTASFVEKDIAAASARLLDAAGVEFTYLGKDEACCGIPMLVAGRWDVFEKIMRHNIRKMKEHGVKTVIASCPACWLTWHTYYPQWAKKLGIEYDFEAKHYSEVISEKLARGEMKFTHPVNMKLTFHDSCHIGRAGGIYEPPRDMLKAIPGVELVEMEHNRENGLCCGSVLTRISEPDPLSNKLGRMKLEEVAACGADACVALCPCCQFQMRVSADANGMDIPVKDLAAVAAKGLGIELPDYTPYVLEMWAVFDKVITLMQVPNMAKLMTLLIPRMMDALPAPLRGMMKMAKVPGLDRMMARMMPPMMPLLMPILMPKVMPDMLREVEKMIEMPDFMKKQMPDLMPKTMENMLPHVLPEIAVLVTPAMIQYVKTKQLPSIRIF
ncbi:MAG: FAD-binding and (Fe-S)-binding domain-containing protein [Clostridiales bacterium]|nr:FAD-binding oxidoreductase [Eubacteriales bacterium]MDH7567099.1 FAD-binding and (Fe-S)-binding domain-containing protein [Clostridiales bacterium]